MNLVEYNRKFGDITKKPRPVKGICHIVQRDGEIYYNCSTCNNFFIKNRQQWAEEVLKKVDKLCVPSQDGLCPRLEIYCVAFNLELLKKMIFMLHGPNGSKTALYVEPEKYRKSIKEMILKYE